MVWDAKAECEAAASPQKLQTVCLEMICLNAEAVARATESAMAHAMALMGVPENVLHQMQAAVRAGGDGCFDPAEPADALALIPATSRRRQYKAQQRREE